MLARLANLLLAATFLASAPFVTSAQTPQVPLQDRWPAPSQELQPRTPAPEPAAAPAPAPQTTPAQAPAPAAAPDPGDDDAAAAKPTPARTKPASSSKPTQRASRKPAGPQTVIACSGVFGPDSNHQELENTFKAQNVTFGEIEGSQESAKLVGSVIFPNDPKRRLEVLWRDEGQRFYIRLIAINGRSSWNGPKGLRLGLALAAVEKINGKPFTLSAINQDGSIMVTDWQGGTLASLPGDCSVGMRFKANPKASEQARAAASAEEFTSTDKALRALTPTTAEILFGYADR